MNKALLIGDYNSVYHSLKGEDDALREIFSGAYELTVSADGACKGLTYEDLCAYSMVIFMPNSWDAEFADVTRALITYVSHGGNLLCIHQGLMATSTFEIAALLGATFRGHPPYGALRVIPTDTDGLCAGMEEMSLLDECYCFDLNPFMPRSIPMTMRYGELSFPAAWTRKWAEGKVACVAPGHDEGNIRKMAPLLKNIGKWFLDEKEGKTE